MINFTATLERPHTPECGRLQAPRRRRRRWPIAVWAGPPPGSAHGDDDGDGDGDGDDGDDNDDDGYDDAKRHA